MRAESIPTLPGRLRELRDRAGFKREELAFRSDISFVSLVRIETGKQVPSLAAAMRIAAALGCTLDSLVQPAEKPQDIPGRGRPKNPVIPAENGRKKKRQKS